MAELFAVLDRRVESVLVRSFTRSVGKRGPLQVRFASGRVERIGEGDKPVHLRFLDGAAERAVALDPALRLGEMYMDGRLVLEQGSLYDLLALLNKRGATPAAIALHGLRSVAGYGRTRLSIQSSAQNVAHHYDLDERLFRLFLDDDLQYSCAYFERPTQTLEGAQLAKKRHLAAKLCVEPGQRVLDIGSGWGGLGLYLGGVAGAQVVGVTLSDEQLRVSRARAEVRGLADRVDFRLEDYRAVEERFDRIVSVGMFEHVGQENYDTFFGRAAHMLDEKGVFVLHSIGRTKPHRAGSPFLEKYIFPGSYMPALSEVLPHAERAGFLVKDVEVLPLHYADTLRIWRQRFLARAAEARALYDDRFVRMWEFYLASAELGFRRDRMFVFQLQLVKSVHAVPRTRDDIARREALLRAREAEIAHYAAVDGDVGDA